jgi:hypothetical protein
MPLPIGMATGNAEERSGGICSRRKVAVRNSVHPSRYPSGKSPLSPCHLDRSEAQWRDLCVDAHPWKCFSTERTRISYFAMPAKTTYAALLKESRMQIIKALGIDRKSGEGAQWRDLRFNGPFLEMFFDQACRIRTRQGQWSQIRRQRSEPALFQGCYDV